MEIWRGRKRLVCFYCGCRSKYVQDGSVREWECAKCDAVNYLDENGEITDPPVAELHKVPSSLKYAQAVPKYDLAAPSRSENRSFCDACLKNQHLFTSSLAQYIPDDSNPLIDRKYIKFREDLEKRYPQVCEDCAPNVLQRYNQSQYTAKADHIRRLMDRTRKYGGPGKSQRSWIDIIGRTLYFLGIFGQVCWNVVGLYRGIRPRILDTCDTDEIIFEEQPSGVQHVSATLVSLTCWVTNLNPPFAESLRNSISILISNSRLIPRLVGWSFWLSVVSVWWNPKMKQSISGFDSHLKGLSDWYKYSVILLVARIIFCSVMESGVINKLDASATLGAHTFMLGFTIFVMIVAPKSIKSDTGRLFIPLTPEKLRPYVGRSKAAAHRAGDITPNPLARNALLPAGNGVKVSGVYQDSRAGILDGSPRSRKRGCPSPSSITNLMPSSFQLDDAEGEEMDWDPAPPQHLNFEPTQAPRSSQLFSQPTASVPTEPSFFRGKLPPAPISMAHKLRNPPNQPRLLPPTREAKENFFDRMSGRRIVATDDDEAISTSGRQSGGEFAPPRFFHDNGDDPTGLTEAFESAFRLGPDEASVREKKLHLFEIKSIDWTHLCRALVLLLIFFVWKYALTYPSENRANLPPISMVVCGFVALLSIYNYTVSPWAKKQSKSVVVLGGIFATMQTFAAGYIVYDLRARTAYSEIPHLQGALLIGTMLIQEACFIAFRKG